MVGETRLSLIVRFEDGLCANGLAQRKPTNRDDGVGCRLSMETYVTIRQHKNITTHNNVIIEREIMC